MSALDDDEILQRILVRAAILADDELLASRKLCGRSEGGARRAASRSARPGTLFSTLVDFKRFFDDNAPLTDALPQFTAARLRYRAAQGSGVFCHRGVQAQQA